MNVSPVGQWFGIMIAFSSICGCRSESKTTPSSSVAETAIDRDSRYPAHWWEPADKAGAPGWEILPQEAGPGEVILSKRNELGLLSNFAATPFEFQGKQYASIEGFWQAMKFPEGPDDERATFPGLQWPHTREEVEQMTGFEAKRAGDAASHNMESMGIDWVTFDGKKMEYRPAKPAEHYELIVAATRAKVRQNPDVKRVLLATDSLALRPDHHQPRDATAAWRYFEILMNIRDELKSEQIDGTTHDRSMSRE